MPNVRKKTGKENWRQTLRAFDWNMHQVYPTVNIAAAAFRKGDVCEWEGKEVVVVHPGKKSHRVIFREEDTRFFPKSFTVCAANLDLCCVLART